MIKFRYVYSNGKEIKSFIYTIEDVENGIQSNKRVLMNLHGFKLISRDRHTGLKDKNGVSIFENDVIEYEVNECEYRVEFLNGEFIGRRFYTNIENLYPTDFDYGNKCEIISNTHIKELKELK